MTTPVTHPPHLRMALGFARFAKAMLVAGGDVLAARAFAEGQRWDSTPMTNWCLKAAVDAMSTGNSDALAPVRPIAGEFLAVVRASSVLGRLVGLRKVPANTSMLKATSGPTARWAGEGKAAGISLMSLEREVLLYNKIVSTVIVTEELMLRSGDIADMLFAAELVAATAAFEDQAFLDPDAMATADRPASISYGAPSLDSTGSSAAAVRSDLKALFLAFGDTAALERAQLVLHPRTALHLSLLEGTAGGQAFPDIGVRGGNICGVPAMTSSACALYGSPSETFMALVDPAQILVAEDGGVEVEVAKHASVQLSDEPSSAASTQVSLWQSGLRGIRLEVPVTWKRVGGVSVLRGCNY